MAQSAAKKQQGRGGLARGLQAARGGRGQGGRGRGGAARGRAPEPEVEEFEEVDEAQEEVRESRRERFERLATARVRRVLKDLRLVGNLASDNYQYDEEDAALIEETLREQVDEVIARFKPKMRGSRGEVAFSLHRVAEEA